MTSAPKRETRELRQIPSGAEVVLEPHGFVKLQAYHASDLDVVNAARVSLAKESEWEYEWGTGMLPHYVLSMDDASLLRYLLKNRHGTPFEHTFFKFHIRAPIFVFREWHRHRIGVSINEESGRYVELAPDFYVPDKDHVRTQAGKPGQYTFEPIEDDDLFKQITSEYYRAYTYAYTRYQHLLHLGVAKELARAVLPVGLYSQMIWSCNARSLMAFLSLRNHPTALREIRDFAAAMETILERTMPTTAEAFVSNGRIAP